MGVVTRSGLVGLPANPCKMCKVNEKDVESDGLCKVCLAEENIKSTAQDKTIYIQMRNGKDNDVNGFWYAIQEKKQSPESLAKAIKGEKEVFKGYMNMGPDWTITRLNLPRILPFGYKLNVTRLTAVPFKSRIYLFGGVHYPYWNGVDSGVVSDVLSFDVRSWEWYPSTPMPAPRREPCVIVSADGESLDHIDFSGVKKFVPGLGVVDSNNSTSTAGGGTGTGTGMGVWVDEVPHGYINEKSFSGLRPFPIYEEDGRKKLLLYSCSHLYLIKYDLESKSVEDIVYDFGQWQRGGVVLFDHYLFCFGVPGNKQSQKPCTLYAFNLRNFNSYTKVRNLPKPTDEDSDDKFPFEDSFNFSQMVCLFKINDCNNKLALIWNSVVYSGGYNLLSVLKFTIVKSDSGKLFEARVLSTAHCFVDGIVPISCLAM